VASLEKTQAVIGCNLHDWIVARVAVLPTPRFHVIGKRGCAALKEFPIGQRVLDWE
jgi:hypothetical protein